MTYLITGTSKGLGKELTKNLLKQKKTVIGISRNTPDFNNNNYHHFNFDLNKIQKTDLIKITNLIKNKKLKLDTLILNAGISIFKNFLHFKESEIKNILNINLISHIKISQFFLPLLLKNKGNIIGIGSIASLEGKKLASIYNTSKFALRGFLLALNEEYKKEGLKTSLIYPSILNTEFYDNLNFKPNNNPENFIPIKDLVKTIFYIKETSPYCLPLEINLSHLKTNFKYKT